MMLRAIVASAVIASASGFGVPAPLQGGCLIRQRCATEGAVARPLFGINFGGVQLPGKTSTAAPESLELQEILKEQVKSNRVFEDDERERIDGLLSRLAKLERPFDPKLLGGGPWRAIYTKGPEPRWKRQARLIPIAQSKAYQDYDPSQSTVTNTGEILGDFALIQAFGKYAPIDASRTKTPIDFKVEVDRGLIQVGGLKLNLPISGVGNQRIVYIDQGLRVFESISSGSQWEQEGLVVVQMPETSLMA